MSSGRSLVQSVGQPRQTVQRSKTLRLSLLISTLYGMPIWSYINHVYICTYTYSHRRSARIKRPSQLSVWKSEGSVRSAGLLTHLYSARRERRKHLQPQDPRLHEGCKLKCACVAVPSAARSFQWRLLPARGSYTPIFLLLQ